MKPVHVALQPSRQLAWLLVLMGCSMCTVAVLLPIPLWSRVLAGIAVAGAVLYHLARDAALRLPWSVLALEVGAGESLRVLGRGEGWSDAEVLGSSFVTPWLCVINVRLPGRFWTRTVVLLPDSAQAEPFRRLRVWLKWGMPQQKRHAG